MLASSQSVESFDAGLPPMTGGVSEQPAASAGELFPKPSPSRSGNQVMQVAPALHCLPLHRHVPLPQESGAAHALAQQVPPSQNPLEHSAAAEHAEPLSFLGSQTLALHQALDAQSAPVVQLLLHAVASHAYSPQGVVSVLQLPSPPHVDVD